MVFYADDDLDDLELFTDIVNGLGRVPMTFNWGDDLLHQLDNPPPKAGIVFLDINMPKLSGIEILKKIRQMPLWNSLPIVMLTTSTSKANIESCRKLGANFYVPKSGNYDALENSIKYVLSIDWQKFKPGESDFVYAA